MDHEYFNTVFFQLMTLSEEKTPDKESPFWCDYDPKTDTLVAPNSKEFQSSHIGDQNDDERLLVPTVNLIIGYTIIQPWLTNKEHVMLVGPEACGKRF